MFAINHATTALIIKKKYPAAKMFWLLISVQLIEFLWIIFNYLGIEHTSTDSKVTYLGNIHLYSLQFSHSILSSVLLSFLSYFVIRYLIKDKLLALPFSLGVMSHITLDLLVHAKDIPLTFFPDSMKLGSQLYSLHPYIAFTFELAYGVFCWYYFKGTRSLFLVVLLFNIANFTTFSPDIIGLEKYFAGNPLLLVSIIALQIIVTLTLVGYFSKKPEYDPQSLKLNNKIL